VREVRGRVTILSWWTLYFRTPDDVVHWRFTSDPRRGQLERVTNVGYGCASPYHMNTEMCVIEVDGTPVTCLRCVAQGPWDPRL
jgi:hypothetical protein